MSRQHDQVRQDQLLAQLLAFAQQAEAESAPVADTPLMRVAQEFFINNWADCREGLLEKTSLLRLVPERSAAPRAFRFELDRPFKRKPGRDAPVELHPGPIRGLIRYRADLFLGVTLPCVAVQVDPALAFFHPNCSRQRGSLVCLGELPGSLFPFPLDLLIETRIFPILSYQDRRPSHPFDLEAASYFALEPTAMVGLEPVEPLY